ncbi:hypothetical protein BN1708_009328 [Verticillium longisporum]|uniref:Actin interacting protein 3 C-terminal domain-containing protein n=1 Tax=Verticillium longisporum TaxID=100787 RepID=A0A0G4KFW8_VERLO|nr:hypothetical protein BN1708_009328 [Verticillium longisporum]
MTASQDTAVPPAMGPKIAIIGAGPAGCMLARLLHRANVSVTVFESEASLDFRSQGGTLDLHTSTGLLAMKEAGLWDEFLEHARYDGQYIAWVDRHARQHFVMGASSARSDVQERPEIDRAQLRRILAASLPEGMIKWDHRLRRVEAPNTLVFDKLTTSDFDLVVGAEGAWSKVRKFVKPDVDPTYTGIGLYELSIPNASVTAPELYQLVNRGSVFGHADGKRLSIQQMGDGSLNVYVSSLKDGADWMRPEKCGHDTSDLAAAKEALMEEYRDWDSTITDAILKPQGACKTRSLYMLPAGFRWEHHRGVTVIGDAAHLMGPFAGGGGVNVALEDAMRLAASIIAAAQNTEDGKETLDRQVDAFEKDMFPRMEKVQRLTDELMHDYFHTPGVPQSIMARVLTRHVKLSTPAQRDRRWNDPTAAQHIRTLCPPSKKAPHRHHVVATSPPVRKRRADPTRPDPSRGITDPVTTATMQAPGPSRMQRRSPGATEPGPPPNVPVRPISPGVGMNPQMRSSTASSRSAQSSSSRRGKDSTGSANMPLSQIEKSVTHLLVATKQLLETLTQWSRGQATDGQVSDVYVRLGYEFNMACRAFSAINVDTSDLPEGYSDLSIGRLQLAFIEKFSWNTHSNGADLPDIYIQDPVSGVRHELEDLSDIKDRTVLVLNIEALDEVKRHVDEGIGSLKQIIQDVKQGMSDQSIALQLVSERQQETATELARLAAAPSTIVQTGEGSKATTVASGRKLTPGHLTELQILRRDLAVMRQTYSNFQSEIQGSMAAIRSKASNVKAATINASVPHINGDGGYTYVSKGREQLNQDSDRLVTKVDDLQDTVEDLRKDVVHRGVRPLPRQLEGVAKDITRLTMELKKVEDYMKQEKPIWTKIWEKELEDVCKGRDELRLMEDLMVDLQDDLEKASETFALVEAATKEQLKDNGTGASAGNARNFSKGLNSLGNSLDQNAAKEGVLGAVRALMPNHEDRLEAIERAEKLRQRELATRNTNKLQQELTNFVEEGRLKKSGGFEEVERARTAKDERIRREVWERQNGLIMDDFGDEEFDEDEEFEGEEGVEEAGDEQLLEDVNGDEAAVDTPPSPPPAEGPAPVVNGNVS